MPRKPTVYIVDSQTQVRSAVTRLVKPLRVKVETFSRAYDFLDEYRDAGPACLVAEVRLPDMSGLDLQTRLVKEDIQIPLIFLAGFATVRMAVAAMKAGAENLFQKPYRPQELLDEIRQTLRKDAETWKRRHEEQSFEGRLAPLKPRLREVLDLMAEGKINVQIAQELGLSVRGVEARRALTMKTLRVGSKAELKQLLQIVLRRKSRKGLRGKKALPFAEQNGKPCE